MSNKLQELTDKLYQEGLSKGRQEGEQIVGKAKEEAVKILDNARKEAEEIVAAAKRDAEQLKAKTESDLKMASVQTVSQIRQQLENAVTAKAVATPVKAAFADSNYVKSLITTVVNAFNASDAGSVGLDVILPEAARKELGDKAASQMVAELGKGIDVSFSKNVQSGFKVGPKDGGYLISFTGEDFAAMFSQYLRPAARKILFGE